MTFVCVWTDEGPKYVDPVIDESVRERLTRDLAGRMTSEKVLERLSSLFVCRSMPRDLRSDHGPEFNATEVRHWLAKAEVMRLDIELGDGGGRTITSSPSWVGCGTRDTMTKSSAHSLSEQGNLYASCLRDRLVN